MYELVGEYIFSARSSLDVDCDMFAIASYKGSVSAEHGVGLMKTHALHYSKNATSIDLMRRIKNLFDPHGIMNPGKVLP